MSKCVCTLFITWITVSLSTHHTRCKHRGRSGTWDLHLLMRTWGANTLVGDMDSRCQNNKRRRKWTNNHVSFYDFEMFLLKSLHFIRFLFLLRFNLFKCLFMYTFLKILQKKKPGSKKETKNKRSKIKNALKEKGGKADKSVSYKKKRT